ESDGNLGRRRALGDGRSGALACRRINMRPERLLVLVSLLAGCADEFVMKVDLNSRDFSGTAIMDMTADGNDLGTADMAQQPDLAPSPDLTPIACDLGGPAADAGTVGRLYLAVVGTGKAPHTASYFPGTG